MNKYVIYFLCVFEFFHIISYTAFEFEYDRAENNKNNTLAFTQCKYDHFHGPQLKFKNVN